MDEAKKSQSQDVALTQSLVCATLGLLASMLLVGWMFRGTGLRYLPKPLPMLVASIIISIIGLYAAAACLGTVAGKLICRVGLQGLWIWIIGVGLAWGCLLVSVLAGSTARFFVEIGNERAFEYYLFTPVFFVMLFGSLPAVGLGIFYATRVRKYLREG